MNFGFLVSGFCIPVYVAKPLFFPVYDLRCGDSGIVYVLAAHFCFECALSGMLVALKIWRSCVGGFAANFRDVWVKVKCWGQ